MKDTQQQVTESSSVPDLRFTTRTPDIVGLAEVRRKGRDMTRTDLLAGPSVSFICGGKTFNKLFENLG